MAESINKYLCFNPRLSIIVAAIAFPCLLSACSDIKKGEWLGSGDVSDTDVEVLDVADVEDDAADGSDRDSSTSDRLENDLADADAPADADLPIDTDVTPDLDASGDVTVPPSCTASDDECVGRLTLGQCEKAHCDSDAGICVPVAKDDDTQCSDGNLCTDGDKCTSGVCVSGPARDCDDANPCTVDNCDPLSGCTSLKLSTGTCDTYEPCTINGNCVDGTCVGEADPLCQCPAPGWDCLSFEDNLRCNGILVCDQDLVAPKCVLDDESVIVCGTELDTECSKNTCTEPDGECAITFVREGLGCDDRNLCTTGDVCREGLCSGSSYSCDDLAPCTLDACDGQGGCSHRLFDDACRIDGECFAVDSVNPANSCEFCVPLASRIRWTLVPSGETETCNANDDDCDGVTDEPDSTGCLDYFIDVDGDTFGLSSSRTCLCAKTAEYSATRGEDCNDDDKLINPARVEICNGKDDDCDGITDPENTIGGHVYYRDFDDDGYGSGTDFKVLCTPSVEYSSLRNDDCDDDNPNIYPGAAEICNGKDDNCSGATDEENATGCDDYFKDFDRDGYGDVTNHRCLCGPILGTYDVTNASDCCDSDLDAHPGQEAYFSTTNECGKYDYDCNGSDAKQWPDTGGCDAWSIGSGCGLNVGWSASPVPECGVTAQWVYSGCGYQTLPMTCKDPVKRDQTQACR